MWQNNSNNAQNFENGAQLNVGRAAQSSRSNSLQNVYEGLAAEMQGSDAFRTLFLGDLSYFCTEEDLCAVFASYGHISTVRVRRGVTGESLMHGFIALDSHEAAKRAIVDLDGKIFMGRSMRVQLSSEGPRPSASKDGLVQIHVSFISKQLNFLVTEVILREIFSPYGRIADVAVRRHAIVQKHNRQSGYGFVYFQDIDAAYTAMAQLKQSTIRDITFDCSISHKSEHFGKLSSPRANDMPNSARGNNFRGVGIPNNSFSNGNFNLSSPNNGNGVISNGSNNHPFGANASRSENGSVPALFIPSANSLPQSQQQQQPSLWGSQSDASLTTASAGTTPRTQAPLSCRESRVGSADLSRDFSYMSLQSFQTDSTGNSGSVDAPKMLSPTWASTKSSSGSSGNTPMNHHLPLQVQVPSTNGAAGNLIVGSFSGSNSGKSRLTASAPEFVPSSSAANSMFSRLSTFSDDFNAPPPTPSPAVATAHQLQHQSNSLPPPLTPTMQSPPQESFLHLNAFSANAHSANWPTSLNVLASANSHPSTNSAVSSSVSSSYTSQGGMSLPGGFSSSLGFDGGNRSRHGSNHSGYALFDNFPVSGNNNSGLSSSLNMTDVSSLSRHASFSATSVNSGSSNINASTNSLLFGSVSATPGVSNLNSSSNTNHLTNHNMFLTPSADAVALSNMSSLMGNHSLKTAQETSGLQVSHSFDDSFAYQFSPSALEQSSTMKVSPTIANGKPSLPAFLQLGWGSNLDNVDPSNNNLSL
jgi:RNA recognition motif-containing protein